MKMEFSEIAAIVAIIGAVVSPVATTYLNNKHAEKMRQLEYEHQDKIEKQQHDREIYEGYIRAAGACVQAANTDALQDMMRLEKINRYSDERTQRVELLNQIIGKLRELRTADLGSRQ